MSNETSDQGGNNGGLPAAYSRDGDEKSAVGESQNRAQLSPQDIRDRRLEALGQGKVEVSRAAGGLVPQIQSSSLKQAPQADTYSASPLSSPALPPSSLKAPPTSPTTPTFAGAAATRNPNTSHHVTIKTPPVIYIDDDDENDSELQAALAMSLAVDTEPAAAGMDSGTNPINAASASASHRAFNNDTNDSSNSLMKGFIGDNDDEALKAALRLSLNEVSGKERSSHVHVAPAPEDDYKMPAKDTKPPNARVDSPATEWYTSARPSDMLAFHEIMWDVHTTTENDKLRWVGQGINFRDYDEEKGKLNQPVENETLLTAVISNFGPWGLTQAHGGPCGVLASVQAELLRIILFGPRHIDGALEYPIMLTNDLQVRAKPDMSDRLMQQGLAMSIAIILARSALMPPADATLAEESKPRDESARIVLPAEFLRWYNDGPGTAPAQLNLLSQSLPEISLSWDSFEPWLARPSSENGTSKSTKLHTFTISSNSHTPSASFGPKRQKTHGNMSSMSIDQRVVQLAHAISSFLLYPPAPGRPTPLDAFRQPGGVVLLTMSLVNSRGQKLILSDTDDPIGTKLTSQFGHCGQELINLLLTGQAVSNVFDNTLTPSGELTCKGVQSRPAIGYLSQLESMRYVEVGGYYKTPRFPIWVVGSASHFTVMFGDAACLNESQSDILLERCRRSFKAIDGGEENGFIATHHLGGFLKSLDLEYPDHSIQTLAATIEVHGAGIILWDDLWKHTSRLLMGASLETVLQLSDTMDPADSLEPVPLLLPPSADNSGAANQNTSLVPTAASLVDSVPPAGAPPSSDEEMAKRLDAEWNTDEVLAGEFIPNTQAATSAAMPPTAAAAAQPEQPLTDEELARKLQAQWDAELPSAALANLGEGGSGSLGAVRGSPTPANWKGAPDDMSVSTVTTNMSNFDGASENEKIGPKPAPPGQTVEKYGKTFQLYHYNGLRGGALKPFRVTRLTPEEAVGASVALIGNASSAAAGGSGDLEDVVRTKWPSSMIDWLGSPPPSID